MPSLVVYSRQGCHLCEVLIEELLPLVRDVLEVEIRDIDSRADWRETYDIRVPVVEFNGECLCQYQLDPDAIEKAIAKTST
jgi:predicted thioredoxin/glutaredoxin